MQPPIKTAYLTIDDGPSPLMAERVELLARHTIPAIWFCRGDYLTERPEAAIDALRNGSILGNHTFNHSYCSKLTIEQFRDEIDRTERIIDALHSQAGVPRRLNLFRFPYEDVIGPPAHFAALQTELSARGFVRPPFADVTYPFFHTPERNADLSVFWTYDTRDWSLPAADAPNTPDVLAQVIARMELDDPADSLGLNHPGSAEVIVMHDHGHTGVSWDHIIERLVAKGLRFALPV